MRQLLYNWYKTLETREHRLLYLFLEITQACNLRCLHCGSDCTADSRSPSLDLPDWLSLIDHVSEGFSPELLFVITGGEPLLDPHLLDITRHIQRRGRRWGLVTNGWMLDAAFLSRLVDAGLHSITISLDGGEQTHDWLRGVPGSWRRALRAVTLAAKAPVPLMDVVTCVHPGNLKTLSDTARTLLDAGVRSWRLFRIFPKGRAAGRPELLLTHGQTWELLDWIRDNRRDYRGRGLGVSYSCEGWLPFGFDRRVRPEPFFCRAGVSIASVLCDGTITGCPNNDPSFAEGIIRNTDFRRAWQEGFARFRDRALMKKGICERCGHFSSCQGGSMHLRTGSAESPVFCCADREQTPRSRPGWK